MWLSSGGPLSGDPGREPAVIATDRVDRGVAVGRIQPRKRTMATSRAQADKLDQSDLEDGLYAAAENGPRDAGPRSERTQCADARRLNQDDHIVRCSDTP